MTVSSGSQLPVSLNAFSPASTSFQAIALAVLGGRGVEHLLRRGPDVDAGAVALDERDDRLVGNVEAAVGGQRDLLGHGRRAYALRLGGQTQVGVDLAGRGANG